jgi:lambda family phage tail tape measure protein
MTDVIGKGVVIVEVDASKAKTGLDTASRSIENYIKKIQAQADNVGKTASELKLLELAQKGATQAQLDAAAAALKTIDANKSAARAQRESANAAAYIAIEQAKANRASEAAALRSNRLAAYQAVQLSYQLQDFFVQVTSGQSVMTALIQQGSQLHGTFGGFGNTLSAIGKLFTPLRVAIGGVATVIGGLGFAMYRAAEDAKDFQQALIKSGNIAGQTDGKFKDLAASIAKSRNTSIGNAKEVGQTLISSGQIPSESFRDAFEAAIAYQKITKKTADEVAKDFARMADNPAALAAELLKASNLLSADQVKKVEDFQKAGDAGAALGVIFGEIKRRGDELEGTFNRLDRALEANRQMWSSLWNSIKGFFSDPTIEEKLRQIDKALGSQTKSGNTMMGKLAPSYKSENELIAQRNELLRQQFRVSENADAEALDKGLQRRLLDGRKIQDDLEKRAKSVDLYKEKLAALKRTFQDEVMNGTPVPAERQKLLKDQLAKDFAGPKGEDQRSARIALEIEKIKASLSELEGAYVRSESILEAVRSAGLLSESEYYEAKRGFINLETDAKAAALEKEIAVYEKENKTAKGKDALDNTKHIITLTQALANVRADAAAKLQVLGIQEKSATDQITRAYIEAKQAAQEYLDVLQRSQTRELGSVGLGDKERGRLSGRNQIEDLYSGQRVQLNDQKRLLESLGKFNGDEEQKYKDKLSVINDFQQKALASFDEYYRQLGVKQADGVNGVTRALQNYLDAGRNMAAQTEGLVNSALGAWEDAFVQFAQTGKITFKTLADGITEQIARMTAKDAFARLFESAKGGSFGDTIAGVANKTASTMGGPTGLTGITAMSSASSTAATMITTAATSEVTAMDTMTLTMQTLTLSADSAAAAMARFALAGGESTSSTSGILEKIVGTAISAYAGGGIQVETVASGAVSADYKEMPNFMRGGRAIGGPVSPRSMYEVNEKGTPELLNVAGKQYLMTGSQGGTVDANPAIAHGGNTFVTVHVTPPAGSSRETALQFGNTAGRQLKHAMKRNG